MKKYKFTFVKPDGSHEETTGKANCSCMGAAKLFFERKYGIILKFEEL